MIRSIQHTPYYQGPANTESAERSAWRDEMLNDFFQKGREVATVARAADSQAPSRLPAKGSLLNVYI